MNEIKELLAAWKNNGFANEGSLEAAHAAIALILAKIEEIEDKVQ